MRIARALIRTAVGLTALGLGGAVYMGTAYRGFTADLVHDFRAGSLAEFRAKYAFLYYYARYYEQLRLNPETNMFDLEDAVREAHNPGRASHFDRALLDFHTGRFREAVAEIEADIKRSGETRDKLFWLGMSYLRLGEAENCLTSGMEMASGSSPAPGIPHQHAASSMSCSLPLTEFHRKKQSSESAGKVFARLLDRYDPGNPLYRWLLNFSYMTIDRFPGGVPERYRIETPFIDAFYGKRREAAAAAFPDLRLADHARDLGVDTLHAGKGVAVEDFNGDGWLDIVTGGTFSGTRYYENDRGRPFIDKSAESGLANITQAYMITAADYDNDGHMDLLVSRPFQRFHLLHNDGKGHFTDETLRSGLLAREPGADEAVYTCVTAWADVNNDGKLDLFMAQFAQRVPFVGGLLARKPMTSRLFLNAGNGRFEDRTDSYGLGGVVADSVFIGATFGDYDGDGWPDLFLSSVSRHKSVLLRNIGGQRLEPTTLIDSTDPGFTTAFVDVDHDGRLDLFQGSQAVAAASTANAVFGRNTQRFANRIFLQRNGRFEKRSDFFGGDMPIGTMGSSYGDLNNDGCLDFYLGTGSPEAWFVLPNLLYLGETQGTTCTGKMRNTSMLFGAGTIQKGHAIVFFDFNNDGLQDIYSSLGGMWPGDAWTNQLFVNQSTTKNAWIKIRLRGTRSNASGVGAAIQVTAVNTKGDTIIRAYNMDSKTGFGSAPYLAQIGLMDAASIRSVQVRWPGSGKLKTYSGRLNELNVLREDEGTPPGRRI